MQRTHLYALSADQHSSTSYRSANPVNCLTGCCTHPSSPAPKIVMPPAQVRTIRSDSNCCCARKLSPLGWRACKSHGFMLIRVGRYLAATASKYGTITAVTSAAQVPTFTPSLAPTWRSLRTVLNNVSPCQSPFKRGCSADRIPGTQREPGLARSDSAWSAQPRHAPRKETRPLRPSLLFVLCSPCCAFPAAFARPRPRPRLDRIVPTRCVIEFDAIKSTRLA